MEENIATVTTNPTIQVRGLDMEHEDSGNEEFSKVIVNIIDDDGNFDPKMQCDDDDGLWMETKNGAFSPNSSESRSPRSKSNSLNSDQLISHLR